MNPGNKWDLRYSEPGFAYGVDPNDFLVQSTSHLPPGGKILCLAEGEGRNSVFLAKEGFTVTGVDSSHVAMTKTNALANKHGVEVETVVADLANFDFGEKKYDGIVSVFCHLPAQIRKIVHQRCIESLKDGGVFILEGYTPCNCNTERVGRLKRNYL